MNDYNYSSLTEKLKQNGIIKEKELPQGGENFFKGACNENEIDSSLEIQVAETLHKNQKRLNKSDFELINENTDDEVISATCKFAKRFLNIKQTLCSKDGINNFENFLFAFFPKLYKAKLVRDSMQKFKELNIDTQKLYEKAIPYGENETRYQDLIKYLNCASEIQTDINKKTN